MGVGGISPFARPAPLGIGGQVIRPPMEHPRLWAPPWVQPPGGAVPFIQQGVQSVTGDPFSDVSVVLASLITPTGYVGVVRELAYQINDVTTTTKVTFGFRVNQGLMLGTALRIFPKSASHDLVEFDPNVTMIRVPNGANVDVLVTVGAGDIATYLVGTTFRGWWYPEELERQYAA